MAAISATNGRMTEQVKSRPRQNRSMFIAAITGLSGVFGGLSAMAAGTLLGSEALAKLGQTLDPLRYAKQSYHIRKGDTLARVAQKSRVDLTDLMRWNGLKRGSILQIGQSIAIYRRVREPVRPRTEAMVCHAGPFLAFGCVGPDRS